LKFCYVKFFYKTKNLLRKLCKNTMEDVGDNKA